MNRTELNQYAIGLVKEAFNKIGYIIEKSSLPPVEVNFQAISPKGKSMKIKVRAMTRIGSYIYNLKKHFNINDVDLYMAVVYLPPNDVIEMYLVPATAWKDAIYPFEGKDYNKPGQVSSPEWGISFSMKAKDAMEPYRFSKIIDAFNVLENSKTTV